MNNAEGVFKQRRPSHKESCFNPTSSKGNMMARKDLMAGFKASKKYAFYWRLKHKSDGAQRFVPKQAKLGFEQAMMLDTVLENADFQETSSFM